MSSSCLGVTSNSTARASGRSASVRTGRPVSIVAPSSASRQAIASAIRCDPPRAAGHPATWPDARSMTPIAVVNGRSSGRNECADAPAKSPFASSVLNARAATVAGSTPRNPNARHGDGVAWHAGERAQGAGRELVPAPGRPSHVAIPRRGRRHPDRRPSRSTDWCSTPARPPSRGWANAISGWTSSRPCRSSSAPRKNGETAAIGWMAEQTSWANPGRVSAAVRMPPPMVAARLEHEDGTTRRCAGDGGGQPVGAGAHHDDVSHSQEPTATADQRASVGSGAWE